MEEELVEILNLEGSTGGVARKRAISL